MIVIRDHPERGGGKASSAIKYGGIVRAGQSAPVTMKLLTKSLNTVRLPVLSGFGRAIQSLQKAMRGLSPSFHAALSLPSCVSKHSQGMKASCAKNLRQWSKS